MKTITIRRPDDFHLHLRDAAQMRSVVRESARRFARAVVMPNLDPPVTTVQQALDYRTRILAALEDERGFQPLMTLYLTDSTSRDEIRRAAECEHIIGVKYYPAGATTHSARGVSAPEKVIPVLEAMLEADVPLLVHGETTDPRVDIFDRERVFMETVLAPLLERLRGLRVVFEHISTRQAVEFVCNGPETLAATITPQHLLYSRNALFEGGLRPHRYCLPVVKAEEHRQALVRAATGDHSRIFLGTDSAPHARRTKEHPCGCAGIYSAPCALEFYAQVFERADALDKLESFASVRGAAFYRLPPNAGTLTLEQREWRIPARYDFAEDDVIPLGAEESCRWQVRKT